MLIIDNFHKLSSTGLGDNYYFNLESFLNLGKKERKKERERERERERDIERENAIPIPSYFCN